VVSRQHEAPSGGIDASEDESLAPHTVPEGSVAATSRPRHWRPDPEIAEPLSGREGLRLLDRLPLGVVVFDTRQEVRYANQSHRDILGRDIRELGMEAWLRAGCRDDLYEEEIVRQWREYLWQKQLPRIFSLKNGADHLREIEFLPRLLDDGDLLLTIRDVTDNQQAEDALRLTETKLQSVFRHVGTGIALIDRTGRFIDANPAFERLLGYSRGDLVRLGIADCVGLPDIERLRVAERTITSADAAAIEQGLIADPTLSVRFRPREGDLFAAQVRLVPVTGPQGKSLFTAFFVEESRPAVDEGEARGRALLEAIPDLILVLDRHGRIEETIPPSGAWSGIAAGREWVGKNLADCWPSLAERTAARVTRAIDRREVQSWRFGEPSAAYAVRVAPCNDDLAVVVVTDATEEAVAREALARQALAFRHLKEGVIITNLRGRILDWNPAAEAIFGFSLAEMHGQGLAKLYAEPGGEAEFNAGLSRALTENGRWETQCPYFRKDGSVGRAEVAFLAVLESGTPRSLVGIHREIEDGKAGSEPSIAVHWRDRWEVIHRLLAVDSPTDSGPVSLPLKIQARLRAVGLLYDLPGAAEGQPIALADYTRRLAGELMQLTAEERSGAPARFKIRADEGVTVAFETARLYGLLVVEMALGALLLPMEETPPQLVLSLFEGHPRLDLSTQSAAAKGAAEGGLRLLAKALQASLKLEHREGLARWLVRFPASP
jgi:PAS domain S-box-containing protein